MAQPPSLRWDDEYEEWLRVSHRHRILFLKMGMTSQSSLDWFSWENLQETMVFTIKYRAFL
jgi:hypothetical protein